MEMLIFLLLALATQTLAKEYHFVSDLMNWSAAKSYCREKFVDLATIENEEDWARVSEIVVQQSLPLWIGLYKAGGAWQWTEEVDSAFRAWAPGQPLSNGKNCAEATASGWINRYCHISRAFICTGSIRKVWNVVMKTNGDLNPNDPQVKEAVLKQMEKTMGNQMIQWQLAITWRMHPNGKVFNWTQ